MKLWKIASFILLCCLSTPVRGENFPVFGNVGTPSSNLKPFPKWTGVLDRYFDTARLNSTSCDSGSFNPCQLAQWQKVLESLQDKPRAQQIDGVNRALNKTRYVLDPINWGLPDYWETPFEFRSRNGDCEDYAIAKFISLRALGIPNDDMRIVILKDQNLNLMHAVLLVNNDGDTLVLDNQIKQARSASRIYHYKPIFSINETGWWLHQK